MIDLQQYKKVCLACDKILNSASDNDEVVAIPILHVLREHPQCLKLYNFLFNEEKNLKSSSLNLFKKSLNLIQSTLFDSKVNNIRKIQDWMNNYPRKILSGRSPLEVLSEELGVDFNIPQIMGVKI